MTDADTPLRRLIIAVDVHHYSIRDPLGQVDVQETLIDTLEKAAAQSGIDRTRWSTQAQGDAEVAVLPAEASEAVVVADFVRELEHRLDRNNRSLKRDARLRLRVAIHSGIVHMGRNGFPGPAVVETCRLLNAPPLKEALRANDEADLGLIVSEGLFRDIVQPGYRGLRASDFHQVNVSVKEFAGVGYIDLRGSAPLLPPPSRTTEDPSGGTSPNHAAPTYDFGGAQFGNAAFGGGDAVGGDKITNHWADDRADDGR